MDFSFERSRLLILDRSNEIYRVTRAFGDLDLACTATHFLYLQDIPERRRSHHTLVWDCMNCYRKKYPLHIHYCQGI